MTTKTGNSEPKFVGRGRELLVDGLLATFDQVKRTSTPAWVSLEAPTGWGKTRVATEFFSQLAALRQQSPEYWPSSILTSTNQAPEKLDVLERRKRVNPTFTHVAQSIPSFFWWGIACSLRNGTPSTALVEDFSIFRGHEEFLKTALRNNSNFLKKNSDFITGLVTDVGGEVKGEIFSSALEQVLGAAIPLSGLLVSTVRAGVEAGKEAAARRKLVNGTGVIEESHGDIVDTAYRALTHLAIPDLPMVLFIEDIHDADAVLLELIARLVRSDCPILVVSSGWPGFLEQNTALNDAIRQSGDRVIRIDHNDKEIPAPFIAGASLGPLAEDDLSILFAHYYQNVDDRTRRLLVQKYTVPLEIELILLSYREEIDAAAEFNLDDDEIGELPEGVANLYRLLWDRLPLMTRRSLSMATLGIPSVITGDASSSSAWDNSVLLEALAAADFADADVLVEALGNDAAQYAWIRELAASLRQFHETTQLAVAATSTKLRKETRLEMRTRLLTTAAGRLDGQTDSAPVGEDLIYAARLVLAFAKDDEKISVVSSSLFATATLTMMRYLVEFPREQSEIVRLGEGAEARGLALSEHDSRQIMLHTAAALTRMGSHSLAVDKLTVIIERCSSSPTPDTEEDLFEARDAMGIALCGVGRASDAVTLMEALLEDRYNSENTDPADAFGTRLTLAQAISDTGNFDVSIAQWRALLVELEQEKGKDSRAVLSARHALALTTLSSGRPGPAAVLFTSLLVDDERVYGRDHPATLAARHGQAAAVRSSGHEGDGLAMLRTLRADLDRVLGADHPGTLRLRNTLGRALTTEGKPRDAIAALVALLHDSERVQGPEHPDTFFVRSNLAEAIMADGRSKDGLQMYRDLCADQDRVLGREHRDSMLVRNDFAFALNKNGRSDDAIEEYTALIADQVEHLAPTDANRLTSHNNFAHVLWNSGKLEGAEAAFRVVRAGLAVAQGREHPHFLQSSESLADVMALRHNFVDAIAIYEEVVPIWEAEFGPDDPRAVSAARDLVRIRSLRERAAK
ncbi:tetratricopeptide repeat protein [Cryobacterium sp. Y29]|uniref:tetratricopeptide repeat protein n=1 Tax=Cryobacterium sp. Y29 TaxID=2048285 RepID=UPI0011AFDBC2|nr:tetratricopeptide repeat protein [Cryobacterium sp. Y29]